MQVADFAVRKIVVQLEEIRHEGGPLVTPPPVRGAIYAICANPFAGRYIPDLQPAMEDLKPLALDLTDRLVALLGGREGIDAYGKGAIVGEDGESEHGALWHVAGDGQRGGGDVVAGRQPQDDRGRQGAGEGEAGGQKQGQTAGSKSFRKLLAKPREGFWPEPHRNPSSPLTWPISSPPIRL